MPAFLVFRCCSMLVCRFSAGVLFMATLLVVVPCWALEAPPRSGKPAAAETAVIARDLVAAGGLRLQAQRVAKLYLQLGLGLNVPVTTKQIEQALAQTDGELVKLESYGRRPDSQRAYARSVAAWQEMRGTVQARYNPAAAERISQLAEELTIHAGKLAMQVESEAGTPVSRLLDLSSRLNMLAQRLARLYMLAQGGKRSQGLLVDLEQTHKEFAVGMQELVMSRENSSASRDALELVRNQWVFFDAAVRQIQSKSADGKAAQHVASSSERIAESLDLVTGQYARDFSAAGRPAK